MKMQLEQYRGACGCGRNHDVLTKDVYIGAGATSVLPMLVREYGLPKRLVAVCDANTRQYAEEAVAAMSSLLHPLKPMIVLNPENLHADEKAVAKVLTQLPVDAGWLLAVGAGTIHDTTRYVAEQKKIPFVSYPTAASVDGFVSTVCAMTWEGFKKTWFGAPPVAVVADTDVFAKAPYRLTASGVSDVLGKYIALADWKISRLVSGEDYCAPIVAMEQEAVDLVRDSLPAIRAGEPQAMEALMRALILSGLAMQMWENSRPASCAEHHMSHFWEMEVINGHLDALHGEKVGVATNVLLPLYEKAASLSDWKGHMVPYEGVPFPLLEERFTGLMDDIREANTPDPLAGVTAESVLANEDAIKGILRELPEAAGLKAAMAAADVPTELEQIGLDESILPDSKLLSPYVRERISFLRICNSMTDFGL